MKFNISNYVKVKLEEGIKELKRQYEGLKDLCPVLPDFELKIDSDGYSKFQLWSLMSSLGHVCRPTLSPPFETEISIEDKTINDKLVEALEAMHSLNIKMIRDFNGRVPPWNQMDEEHLQDTAMLLKQAKESGK